MTRIVSYVHRPKRLSRKKAMAAAIVTATNKRDIIIRPRKEATDDGQEDSTEIKAFFAHIMRTGTELPRAIRSHTSPAQ
jgi:hypothetical protein